MNKNMNKMCFVPDDKLNRRNQAIKISRILANSENYSRPGEGLVVALNSSWGTGKTMFLKMWENEILNAKADEAEHNKKQKEPKTYIHKNIEKVLGREIPYYEKIVCPLNKENANTLYYNAWEHDDYDNSLIPLIAHLNIVFKKVILREKLKDESIKELSEILKNWGKAATSLAFRVGGNIIKKKLGLDKIDFDINELLNFKKSDFNKFLELEDKFENIGIDDIEEELGRLSSKTKEKYLKIKSAVEPELFEDFENFKRIKKEFRKTLKNISKDKKLIIFVDELDRCRPLYAIETLEAIKHFFSVPNVVFVLSVDIEQLSHSIATVYGQNMDSEGYLMRFVDLQFKLPNPNINSFCDFLNVKNEKKIFDENILNLIKILFDEFNLSLRDMEKMFLNLKLLVDSLNPDLRSREDAISFYITMSVIKHKHIKLYNLILSESDLMTPTIENYIKSSMIIEIISQLCRGRGHKQILEMRKKDIDDDKMNGMINSNSEHISSIFEIRNDHNIEVPYISLLDLRCLNNLSIKYIEYIESKLEFIDLVQN